MPADQNSRPNTPDFNKSAAPQLPPGFAPGFPASLRLPEGSRVLTPEEEKNALPIPDRTLLEEIPSCIPRSLNFAHIPPEYREQMGLDDEDAIGTQDSFLVPGSLSGHAQAAHVALQGVPSMPEAHAAYEPTAEQQNALRYGTTDVQNAGQAPGGYYPTQQAPVAPVRPVEQPVGVRYSQPVGSVVPQSASVPPQHQYTPQAAPVPTPQTIPATYQQPQTPAQLAAPAPVASAVVPPRPIRHPVLEGLLRDFGLKTYGVKTVELEAPYNGYRWSFRKYSREQLNYALSVASNSALSAEAMESRLRTTTMAISLAALNDVPVWEVFGVDTENAAITDTMYPPNSVAILAAGRVVDFLDEHTDSGLADTLWERFVDLWPADGETMIPSQVEAKVYRHKCPVSGCAYYVDKEPEYVNKVSGEIKTGFCPEHGAKLVVIGEVNELGDVPLA